MTIETDENKGIDIHKGGESREKYNEKYEYEHFHQIYIMRKYSKVIISSHIN